jgi:DNA-binding transcriptional LysR family regulator
MQWDDLRIFLAVARAGSISRAAKRMDIQHSTVSRRVKLLERQLGARLLERKKSGYELTVEGEELKVAASRIEAEVLDVEGSLGDRESQVTGELRVSAINNMASGVLMPAFAAFSETHPEIELHLLVSNKYVSLAERQADIAIRLTNSPLETLVGTLLTKVASAVYGRRDYVRSLHAASLTPKWLGIECCAFHQSWTRAACSGREHRFFVDDTLLTIAAVRQGLGLAYLPCFMGDSDDQLERFRPPQPEHELGLWLLYHPDLRRSRRVRAFRDHMVAQMAEQRDLFEGQRPSGEASDSVPLPQSESQFQCIA